jgi:(1->4)-alpha-D-glucan 1-alpha-D-glucosylmutase
MSAIARLCEHLGVAGGYHDIWGHEHAASEATRLALLAALGHPVGGEEEAAETLQAMEDRAWRRGLPPVCVLYADAVADAIELRLCVPAAAMGAVLCWRLHAEDGGQHEGVLAPGAVAEEERRTLADGVEWVAGRLRLPVAPGCGYHRLVVESQANAPAGGAVAAAVAGIALAPVCSTLIVAPRRCYRPAALQGGGRVWGLSGQLFALRSARNWGVGDFTDLSRLVEMAAGAGAGVVGVSPLHALFPHAPCHASPYSPSSRLFLNTLHVDIEAVDEFAACEEARARVAGEGFQARLQALRGDERVRYDDVAALKDEVMAILWRYFRERHLAADDERARAFQAFQRREGEALRRHALFEVLQAHLQAGDPDCWGWSQWPDEWRDPAGPSVEAFAREHRDAVQAREYAQWQARTQLDRVGARAHALGLAVGLYQDLAVGVNAGGSETWSDPAAFALGVRVGAPPDDFSLEGQDWGLPPWRPEALREAAYAPFMRTLRASMQAAGALRIDHVMGLARSFWVPPGGEPADGTYVHYPLRDLMGVLALESHRNRCLVVGEDLGTVPDTVREALEVHDVLSCRLLYFSRDHEGGFLPPQEFPERALVCAATHDLPTLAGFWAGRDLALRRGLGLFPDQGRYEDQLMARAADRVRLLLALRREGLLAEGLEADPQAHAEMTPELVAAIHRYLARTPSCLLTVQLEDLLGQREQVNLPGTIDAYPNWRCRLPVALEAWADEPRVDLVFAALREERGRAPGQPEAPA